jgi:hypothetical protein
MDESNLPDHLKRLLRDIAATGAESGNDEKLLLPLQSVYREDGMRVRLTGVEQHDLVTYGATHSGKDGCAGSQQACFAVMYLMVTLHRLKGTTQALPGEDIITVDVQQLFQTYKDEIKTLMDLDLQTTHDTWAIRMIDAYLEMDEEEKKAKEGRIGRMAFEIFPKEKKGGKKKK